MKYLTEAELDELPTKLEQNKARLRLLTEEMDRIALELADESDTLAELERRLGIERPRA